MNQSVGYHARLEPGRLGRRRFMLIAVTIAMLASGLAVVDGHPAAADEHTELELVEHEPVVLDIDGDISAGTSLLGVPNQCGSATGGVTVCIGGSSDADVSSEGLSIAGPPPMNPLVASGGQAVPALEWIVDEAAEVIPVLYDIPADNRIRLYARPQIQAYVHTRLLDIIDRYVYGVELTKDEQTALDFVISETLAEDLQQTQAAYDEYDRYLQAPCAYSPPARPGFVKALPLPAEVVAECEYAQSLLQLAVNYAPPIPSVEHFQTWGSHAALQDGPYANLDDVLYQQQILTALDAALIMSSVAGAVLVGVAAGLLVGTSVALSGAFTALIGSAFVAGIAGAYMSGGVAAAMAAAGVFAATGVGVIVAAIILVAVAITIGVTDLNQRASIGQTLTAELDAARNANIPLGLDTLRQERAGLKLREGFDDELPEYRGAEFGERLFARVVGWTSVTPSGEVLGRPGGLWTPNITDSSDHRFRIVGTGEIVDSITVRDGAMGTEGGELTARFDQGWMIVSHGQGVEAGFGMRIFDVDGGLVEIGRSPGDELHPGGQFLVTSIQEGVAPQGTISDTIRFFDPAGDIVEVELVAPSANDPAELRPTAVGPLTTGRPVPLRPNPVNAEGVAVPEDFASGWDFEWEVIRIDERTGEPRDVHTDTAYGTSFTPTEPGTYRATVTMTEDVVSPGPAVVGQVWFPVTSPEIEITRLAIVDDGFFEAYLDIEMSARVPNDLLRVSVQWPGEVGSPPPAPVERNLTCSGGGGLQCVATMTLADRAVLTMPLTDETDLHGDVTVTVTNSTGGTVSRTVGMGSTERPSLVAPPAGTADGTEFDPLRTYVEVEIGNNPLTEIARVVPGNLVPGLPVGLGIGEPGSGQSASSMTPLGGLLFVSLVEDAPSGQWVLAIKGQAEVSDLGLHRVPIVISQSDATGPGRALHFIDLNVVPATGDRGRAILDNSIDPLGPALPTVPKLTPTIFGGVAGEALYSGEMCVRLVRAATAFLTPTICDDSSRFVSTTGELRFPYEELQPDGLVANSIYRASAWLTDTAQASDSPHQVSFQVTTGPPVLNDLRWDDENAEVAVDLDPVDPGIPVTAVYCRIDGAPEPCALDGDNRAVTLPGVFRGTHLLEMFLRDANGNYATGTLKIVRILAPFAPDDGYWMLSSTGEVFGFGAAAQTVADQRVALNADETAIKILGNPAGTGAWVLSDTGRVIPVGGAPHHGDALSSSTAATTGTAGTFTTMASTPTGDGYWLFTDLGEVLAFGTAAHHGSLVGFNLNGAVVDSAATTTGLGYWLLGSDGGVFAFGDAEFYGSTGNLVLNQPAVGLVPDPDGTGYWFVAADGGVPTEECSTSRTRTFSAPSETLTSARQSSHSLRAHSRTLEDRPRFTRFRTETHQIVELANRPRSARRILAEPWRRSS